MSNNHGQKLAGKIAVITGGNSGIGLATAKRFVEEGAHVVITGRREEDLKEAAAFIGRNVTTVAGDVSRLEDLDQLYAVVKEKHGHIDIPFANAGGGTVARLATATESSFTHRLDGKRSVDSRSPGPIETPALENAGLPAEQAEQAAGQFASQVPLGRRGKPEEIASAVVFLASDESSFITGVDLAVDGGMAQV